MSVSLCPLSAGNPRTAWHSPVSPAQGVHDGALLGGDEGSDQALALPSCLA